MEAILPNAEKQGGPLQSGGWHEEMARRRFQKGSIRKRGQRNPVWELQWWEDFIAADGKIKRRRGSRILGSASELTKRQARKAADEFLLPLNQGKLLPHSTLKFREFVEQFFIPNAFPALKISTQKRYARTLKTHLLPAFGEIRLRDIRTLEIQQFVLGKIAGGLGWEAADHLRNLLSKVFNAAKRWGFVSGDNPASGVELPEKKPAREKHVILPEQIPALLACLAEPVRTMVELGILTGLRVGEILGLRWRAVDFRAGQIRVEQAVYRGQIGSPKTKGSRRTLPMPERLQGALMRLRGPSQRWEPDHLVFQTAKGTPYGDTNLLHRQLKPAGKRLGMPWLSWHTLRRTHATLFQAAGGSLKEAQAQLGHSKMSTTLDIYTVALPASQRAAVERLSTLASGNSTAIATSVATARVN